MSKTKVIVLSNHFADVKKAVSGAMLMDAAMAGAQVIKSFAQLAMREGKSGVISKNGHQASAPGEAPAIDTGALVNSMMVRPGKQTDTYAESEVGPTVEYGAMLEFGTSKMEARPYMRPAVDEHESEIEKVVIKHIENALEKAL